MEKQPGTVGVFSKDVVCTDRSLDDALALKKERKKKRKEKKEREEKKKEKKNQCLADCTRKGSRLVKKLQPHIGK